MYILKINCNVNYFALICFLVSYSGQRFGRPSCGKKRKVWNNNIKAMSAGFPVAMIYGQKYVKIVSKK